MAKKNLNKHLFIPVLALLVPIQAGCGTKTTEIVKLNPSKDDFAQTINSLVSTDIYGRSFSEKDVASSDRLVGMFYFVWHGQHTPNGIFDVTKLNNEHPDDLWNIPDSPISPYNEFHYFSEPLYGYYRSEDPWVITRHIELLTMSGIDYISIDLTNWLIYEDNIKVLMDILKDFQDKGWKVPLVTSFINGTDPNANHPQRILNFYNFFYKNSKYDSLWLREERTNKPILSINMDTYLSQIDEEVRDNIFFRNTIWPYDKSATIYNDASWMDWTYPQRLYENDIGNYMSVSVAQHPAGAFGYSSNPIIKDRFYNSNRGRGWDYEKNCNVSENAFKGTNLESQWNNAINARDNVDEVFVTGWNEWIAYKLFGEALGALTTGDEDKRIQSDKITFCDTCDEEFSRDLEMTRGGYGDNFYLQNMRLTRDFKSNQEFKYYGAYNSPYLTKSEWPNARKYLDFEGDAIERHFLSTDSSFYYDNYTNRNDIKEVNIANDDNNLYIQVKTSKDIIIDKDMSNNMNILLSIKDSNEPNWNGYNYILNRNILNKGNSTTTLEKVVEDNEFRFASVSECKSFMSSNYLNIAIPLTDLGITDPSDFTIDFKVSDGISDPSDIMNYYIDGDSAPIGRLNYRYNSIHK